jgi:hypothetical protein
MVWLWTSAAPSFLYCDPPEWIWSLCPVNGHPQFFAFSPRLLKREKELSLCLEKAANQASKYKEISVNAGTFYRKKSFISKYLMTLAIDFNRELAAQLLSDLAIVREYRDESGTYIIAELITGTLDSRLCNAINSPDQGTWRNGGVVIKGYYTAVGVAARRRLLSDSIDAADNNAIIELSRQVSNVLVSGAERGNLFGYESSKVRLNGLCILKRSVSEDKRYYYSLAVCPDVSTRHLSD